MGTVVGKLEQDVCAMFTATSFGRSWFEVPDEYKLYLRIGPRVFDGRAYARALTLADVEVTGMRRTGIFTRCLDELESAAIQMDCDAVYVENIHNPIVLRVLLRRGYSVTRLAYENQALLQLKR